MRLTENSGSVDDSIPLTKGTAMDRQTLIDTVIELAERFARRAFAADPDRGDLIEDAKSRAWEFALTAPLDAPPPRIAEFAVRHVRRRRQFRWSIRSVDHPRNPERQRSGLDPADLSRVGEDPFLLTQAKLDVADWFASLSQHHRTVALLLASGHGTGEVAALIGRSPARVSQIREQLRRSWEAFCGD